MKTLHFEGSDFMLPKCDIPEPLLSDLLGCHHQGQCDDDVSDFLSQYTITGDKEDCAKYLEGYGAWDDEELSDHDANLSRLVWLAACDLDEQGEIYFSTY